MTDNWRPDWRDESQYTDHGDDGTRWLWEFLRRDESFIKKLPQIREDCGITQEPDDALADRLREYELQFGIRFALGMRLDPASDGKHIRAYGSEATLMYEGYCRGRRPIEPRDNTEASFKIDLTMPIDRQLEIVRAELMGIQKHVYDKYPALKLSRRDWGQFVRYLRILDAIHQGAPVVERVKVLLNVSSPLPDDYKAIKDVTKKALALSKVQYRQLGMYEPRSTKGYYRYIHGNNQKDRKRIEKAR